MFTLSIQEFNQKKHVIRKVSSPIGALTLVANEDGLRALLFQGTIVKSNDLFRRLESDPRHPLLNRAEHQLMEYFGGSRKDFTLPLDYSGTPFQRRVWDALLSIPYGTTATYGEIAGRLGDPRKARPVGGAVGSNPIGLFIPCHRVIGAGGALTGFGGGLDVKSFLLAHEKRHGSPSSG